MIDVSKNFLKEDEFYISEIKRLKEQLSVTVVAHFYQKDEIFALADVTGDSLELAKKTIVDESEFIVFCGVAFMGESVKVMNPAKRVIMPKMACCSMAKMIDGKFYDDSVNKLDKLGIKKADILPITYINSSAEIKAKVGEMGGLVCTSSNAENIIKTGLKTGKKIMFVPDRCLGQNIANQMGLKSAVIGVDSDKDTQESSIICYDGFCSVHQLFVPEDVDFYREKYPDIKVAVHPECDPAVVDKADFVGSTSQLIKYVDALPKEQKVVVGTEYNLVNRMREENTFVLSSTKPECPTMNETTLEDLYKTLKSIEDGQPFYEVSVDENVSKNAKLSLERMLAL
jgi:quinolinate synthase